MFWKTEHGGQKHTGCAFTCLCSKQAYRCADLSAFVGTPYARQIVLGHTVSVQVHLSRPIDHKNLAKNYYRDVRFF